MTIAAVLVPEALLPRAMAVSTMVRQVSLIAAPAAGGLLLAIGINANDWTCTALFCVSAVMYAPVRYDYLAPTREPVTARTILAGLYFRLGNALLLGAMWLDLFAVLFGGATALLPIHAKQLLHLGPQGLGLGLLRLAPAAGALCVGPVMSHCAIRSGVGKKLLLAVAVYGVCTIAFGLSRSFPLSC